MEHTKGLIGFASVFAVLALGVPAVQARQDSVGFAVYEDWSTADDIRGDRWRGSATSAQDTLKELKGRRAHLRLRREGSNSLNIGSARGGARAEHDPSAGRHPVRA